MTERGGAGGGHGPPPPQTLEKKKIKGFFVKVSHIAKKSLSCRLYKSWTPLLSKCVFWEWVRLIDFYMVSEQARFLWQWWAFPSRCWTRVWPKMPHMRGRVKVSHIAKKSLSCRLYKPWTPLLSQGVFWEWVRPIDFYMAYWPIVINFCGLILGLFPFIISLTSFISFGTIALLSKNFLLIFHG